MITEIEKKELLGIVSKKHYQKYHPRVLEILNNYEVYKDIGVFHANTLDAERAEFMFSKLDFRGLNVLDIGANIGFFTFNAVFEGADRVTAIESDPLDSRLIELQAKALHLSDKVKAICDTYDFSRKSLDRYDATFCLNILHHVGRYFDNGITTANQAKDKIIEYLNLLSYSSKYCWLQLGYNWKGEEGKYLFKDGSKIEVIKFIEENILDNWELNEIGIFDPIKRKYLSNDHNMKRINELGEFGNRPIFLLKTKLRLK